MAHFTAALYNLRVLPMVVMDDSDGGIPGAISAGERCSITVFIAQRMFEWIRQAVGRR